MHQSVVETPAILILLAINDMPSKCHMLNMCMHVFICYLGKGYWHFSAISLYISKIFVVYKYQCIISIQLKGQVY